MTWDETIVLFRTNKKHSKAVDYFDASIGYAEVYQWSRAVYSAEIAERTLNEAIEYAEGCNGCDVVVDSMKSLLSKVQSHIRGWGA